MKKKMFHIAIKPFNNPIFYNNNIFNIDDGHNIFYGLKKELVSKNIILNTVDLVKNADIYIYCDVPYIWQLRSWLKLVSHINKNYLLVFESPVINPFNQWKIIQHLFKKIYTWCDDDVNNKNIYKTLIPQCKNNKFYKVKYSEKKFLVAVYSNKEAPPFFDFLTKYKNLYTERNSLIKYLDEYFIGDFSLYGKGWNKPKKYNLGQCLFGFKIPRSYKGEVKNKIDTISKFKFCLAIENALAPGYITEKIFDCFQASCIPIYLGSPAADKYIPKSAYIDLRDYKNYQDLLTYIINLDEKRIGEYIKNGQDFINKPDVRTFWFKDSLINLLINISKNKCK